MNKKIAFIIFLITILLFPRSSFAYVWEGGVDGVGGYVSSCIDNNYCYSMVGIRVSLYKLTDNEVIKVGRSHDYWKTQEHDGDDQNDPKDHGESGDMYSSLYNDDIKDKLAGNKIPGKDRFTVSRNAYIKYDSSKVTYLNLNEWKWDYRKSSESNNFVNWMNDTKNNAIFNTLDDYEELEKNLDLNSNQISDIKNNKESYYLVTETLFGIWVGKNSILPTGGGFSKNIYYVGTVYELNAFTTKLESIQLYAEGLIANSRIGDFVGPNDSYIIKISNTSDKVDQNYIKKNNGVGLAVFKLSDVIQVKTCKDVCRSGNLECYENYCEQNSISDDTKRSCIVNDCKYEEPGTTSCTSDSGGSTDSVCSDTKTSSATKCMQEDTGYNFYSVSCKEKTSVTYSSDLPVTLYPGIGGFNYSAITNGERICTLKFNKKRFEFEYAAKKRGSGARNTLKALLNNYANINGNYDNDQYKYKFDDDAKNGITLNVGFSNPLFTRKLVRNNAKSVTSDYTYTSGSSDNIYMYGATNEIKSIDTEKTFKTTNSELFELPLRCYSLKTGLITDTLSNGECKNDVKNFAYYGYYSTITTKGEIPTVTKAVKVGSDLNDTNTCKYYNVEDPDYDFNCKLSIEESSGSSYKIKYQVLSDRSNIVTEMKANNRTVTDGETFNVTVEANQSKFIPASITGINNGKEITKYCSITIKNPDNKTGESCKEKFKEKRVHYQAISEYCSNNWKIDKDNYSSYSDCYNSCTSYGGTCKTKYKCNDEENIKAYCKNSYLNDGYTSSEACLNDCICKPIGKEYFYRPVNLNNPFPKNNGTDERIAGSNWIGYLENVNSGKFTIDENDDTKYGKKAEYVISLDNDKIKAIRSDTKDKGGLGKIAVDYKGRYEGGVYKSDFVKDYFNCTEECDP